MGEKQEPDWSEATLQRWMGSITRDSTRKVYKSGIRFYFQYTKLSASQLIDEALEDQRRDPREKTDTVKQRLIGFYNWLVNEAPKRTAKSNGVKGVSTKMALTYVNTVRSFYGTYEVYVKLKGRSGLPKARITNPRMILTNLDVKKLIDHTRSPRDRAMILTMFQGGMDVSTLCGIKYRDVSEGLAKNEHPLQLNLYRGKAGVSFFTFLGKDAIESVKVYLNDLRARGLTLGPNDFLFVKEANKALSKEGLTPNLIQNLMRDLAIKAGFIDENLNGRDMNPLGPHSLRESFGSILANHGAPDNVIDFFLGHSISEQDQAYKRLNVEDLRKLYLAIEPHLSISSDIGLETKLKAEIDERNRQLQTLVNGLSTENLELKSRISRAELEGTELKKRLQNMEFETQGKTKQLERIEEALLEVRKKVAKLAT